MKKLATLSFVSEATDVLLLGPPGVGKTHLDVALAPKSIENGQGAYFVRAYDLMEVLKRSTAEHRLDRRMRVYLTPKVLTVDEFGIWPYDRESAIAFFSLVFARYGRGVIVLTSNKGFADWGELLGDNVLATDPRQAFWPVRQLFWLARCLNEKVTEAELLPHVDVTEIRSLPHDGVTQTTEHGYGHGDQHSHEDRGAGSDPQPVQGGVEEG